MDIEYKGGNSLTIKINNVLITLNPRTSQFGAKDVKTTGAIVLASNSTQSVSDDSEKLLISGPGEYEIANVSIRGVAAKSYREDNQNETIYKIEVDGIRLAVISDIHPTLSESQLEEIGVTDIVAVPVGGGETLNSHQAALLVRQIDPKLVIPMHYKDNSLKYHVSQDDLGSFLKELGANEHETYDKLKLKPGVSLPIILTVAEIRRS